jgi:hypothetical protein
MWLFRELGSGDGFPVPEVRDALVSGCGTTACAAGWVAIVTAPDNARVSEEDGTVTYADGRTADIDIVAQRMLGLSDVDALWLFRSHRTRGQVLAALRSLAAGQPMTRLPGPGDGAPA